MEINKKNRTELKNFFEANKIPTEQHFAEFVDAGLNQAEDGIAKVQGNPLALQAEGETSGTQEILQLFSNFADENPAWSLNLNPRVDPQAPDSNQPGFNIKDATGQSRLFIRSGDGSIGVGTIEPESKLTVQGTENGSLIAAIANTAQHSRIFEVTQENGNGMLSLRAGDATLATRLSGAVETPSFFLGNVGMGTATPSDTLTVYDGELALQTANNNGTQGLLFQNSGNSYTWRMYRKDAGGSFADLVLASGLENDFTNLTDRITFRTNGNVGIGTATPSGKLTVYDGELVLKTDNNSETQGLLFQNSGNSYTWRMYRRDAVNTNNDRADLVLASGLETDFTNLTDRVTLRDNGYVGIGGESPEAPLSISGSGKEGAPDDAMHITSDCILFGGNNAGRNQNSAQISAGKHEENSLNIIGMASGTGSADRKIDMWAEGGLTVRGHMKTPTNYIVAFSVSLAIRMIGAKNPLKFDQVNSNEGDHFKNNTHFKAPVAGLYLFAMCMRNDSDANVGWRLRLNGTGHVNGLSGNEQDQRSQLVAVAKLHMNSRTVITKLNAGDEVHVEQFGNGANDSHSSGFEGMLLQAFA